MVHTSDVHLGAYTGANDPAWSARRDLIEFAFERVIDVALEREADALLICGDFFDNDRVRQDVVDFAASEILRFGRPAFLLPGNHDPMDPGKLYHRSGLENLAPNLRLVRAHEGELIEVPGLDLVLWGRAFLDSDWHFRPLAGIPARQDDRWHIAMGHGHFVHQGGESNRSLLIEESEIAALAGQWDYLALGHWEPQADVSVGGMTALYSGAPMPLTDANRRAGWVVVCDFEGEGMSWELARVDPRGGPPA